MSRRRTPSGGGDPVERDDRALDALGRTGFGQAPGERSGGGAGAPVPGDDPVLRMLALWRDDLFTDLPDEAAVEAVTGPDRYGRIDGSPVSSVPVNGSPVNGAAVSSGTAIGIAPLGGRPPRRSAPTPSAAPTAPPRRPRTSRRRRGSRLMLATGVAFLATVGATGVVLAAAGAQPGSPLFPVTSVVYPDQAAVRQHEAAAVKDLADARKAFDEGRDADAGRYLADAERHSRALPGPAADRLRRDTEKLRREHGLPPGPPLPGPSGSGSPTPDPSPDPPQPPTPSGPASPSQSPVGSPSASSSSDKAGRPAPPTPTPSDTDYAESGKRHKPGGPGHRH